MSAPVVERSKAATRTASRPSRSTPPAIPAQRGAGAQKAHAQKAHARKAYAKKEERLRRLVGGVRPARSGTPRRAQFVLLVMALLGTGLVLTLWLSTAAAADSYRLQDARAGAGALGERSEQLRREVAVLASAPEIARRAAEMGMIPVQDPARVVVAEDGSVTVVGEPRVVQPPAPPVVAAPAPVEIPAEVAGTPAEAVPGDGVPAEDVAEAEVPAEEVPADEVLADDAPAVTDEATTDEAATDEAATDEAATDGAATDGATDAAAAGTEPATAPN